MTYVLSKEAVREAMNDLHGRKIHPHFPTYIGITAYAEEQGTTSDLDYDHGGYLDDYYLVEAREGVNAVIDGRVKEYLTPYTEHRPMWKGDNWEQQVSPKTAGRAETDQGLHKVCDIDVDDKTYSLHDNHWEDALEYLCFNERIPAILVATYLYRDYGFNSDEEPTASDLEQLFREEHGFEDDEAFEHLFVSDFEMETEPLFVEEDS